VSEVFYDPSSNPLRMSLDFSTVGPDLRPLPPRRQELFINNIQVQLDNCASSNLAHHFL
jgi:hypothetical protein